MWPAVALVGSCELSSGVPSLLRDVAQGRLAESFATHLASVVLVNFVAKKPCPRGPAMNATPCAAMARS